ncbi:MAG: hypothetical protein ACT4PZ_16525 [Panacagrimonas sp.]
MMSFLLFLPNPLRLEIVGLGGGSLTKFCHRQLVHTRLTTIEVNQDVISLAPLFCIPETSPRSNLIHADAADYFARSDNWADVILLDGCDTEGTAPALTTESFYASVSGRLRRGGIAVANLVGPAALQASALRAMSRVFGDRVLIVNIDVGENHIALAFKGPQWPPNWEEVRARAPQLSRQHQLDFDEYALLLERSWRHQDCRHRPSSSSGTFGRATLRLPSPLSATP